jgi:uncharacterized protein YlxW (UPF0749 family)
MTERGATARPVGGPQRWVGVDLLAELFTEPLDPGYAAATRRREQRGPDPGWQRVGGASLRALAFVVVGFLLMVAYQQVVRTAPDTERARADLAADVAARRAEADGLAVDAERLRGQVARQRDQALPADPERALRDLEARTGLGPVTGSGVAVKLVDAEAPVDPVTGRSGENLGRVLDRDLQDVANALWQAGAEAIAVNGQRLTATSTIRAAGSAILVDFRPIKGPYEIVAIGPGDMDKALLNSATGKRFKQYVTKFGMQFDVRRRERITLPAGEDAGLRFARPVTPSASPSPSGGG